MLTVKEFMDTLDKTEVYLLSEPRKDGKIFPVVLPRKNSEFGAMFWTSDPESEEAEIVLGLFRSLMDPTVDLTWTLVAPDKIRENPPPESITIYSDNEFDLYFRSLGIVIKLPKVKGWILCDSERTPVSVPVQHPNRTGDSIHVCISDSLTPGEKELIAKLLNPEKKSVWVEGRVPIDTFDHGPVALLDIEL